MKTILATILLQPSSFLPESSCSLEIQPPLLSFQKNLYIGGHLQCYSQGARSLLLYSQDQGKKWKEVSLSYKNKKSIFLTKTEEGLFVILSHFVEGAGEDFLFFSKDGKKWILQSKLPKGKHPHQLFLSQFYFQKKGKGHISYLMPIGEENILLSFYTQNWGRSWAFEDAQYHMIKEKYLVKTPFIFEEHEILFPEEIILPTSK